MRLTVAHIGPPKATHPEYDALIRIYIERTQPFLPCQEQTYPNETAFLASLSRAKSHSRVPTLPILLDGSRGRSLSSPEIAAWLASRRDQGVQHIVFAIGPADGWSPSALDLAKSQSGLVLSFGPITMAHSLARLVLVEQIYRACTINAGHPYHSGH